MSNITSQLNKTKNIFRIIEIASVLVVSISMIMYGVGKIVQFPMTTDITKKVSDLTGQELMWAFYGYSKSFPIILGILEIIGGILLLFSKTRLLATILLTTIIVNVILQDIIYNVNDGALIDAIIYQILIIFILIINKKRVLLILKLFTETNNERQEESFKSKLLTALYVGTVFILIKGIEYVLTH